MVRLLRYPGMTCLLGAASIVCALCADAALRASEPMLTVMLLIALLPLLLVTIGLCSCRLIVSSDGIAYGSFRRMTLLPWERMSALGVVCCNSRRAYLYGMGDSNPDFIALVHKAPAVGPWGFVCPLSRRLIAAVSEHCPFEVDFSVPPEPRSEEKRHYVWTYALMRCVLLAAAAAAALVAAGVLIRGLIGKPIAVGSVLYADVTVSFMAASLFCFYQAWSAISLCPYYNGQGISCGGLTLSWQDIRYAFIHRFAGMSGIFLFSGTPGSLVGRGAPPVRVLSMPDLPTILTVVKLNCPEAKAEYGRL